VNIEKTQHLPVIEIQHVENEGEYVLVNQKQVARFDGPTAYDDASRCCATLVQNEIARLERQSIEQAAPHQRYRALLDQISDLRYPDAGPEMRTRIESSIDKKVAEFMAERGTLKTHAREHAQQQQMQPPPAVRQQQRGIDYEL
jgi:hypothetical protein